MAGAGYKLFNTGDVLTAAQVNTYLQEQTVMVFASSTARTTALSGVLAEGMMSYLQDTNSVEVYNGSSWVALASGDVTEVQAGTGISVASGTGPIPVVTNTMATAINAAGDLIYGTANDTFTRLGIGTAGQVLKVNSGATAPEWGTAAAGALTLIKRSTFSGVADTGTTFDGVFTSTYRTYFVNIENFFAVTDANDPYFRFRYAGPTTETAGYYWQNLTTTRLATTASGADADAQILLGITSGASAARNSGQYYVNMVGNASERPSIIGLTSMLSQQQFSTIHGVADTSRTYTGFILSSSSSNISGTVSIYGLATA